MASASGNPALTIDQLLTPVRSLSQGVCRGSIRQRQPVRQAAAKKFLNSPKTAVVESLEGLVAATPYLERLDGFPGIKVVFDGQAPSDRVAVIAGGGSGHEPSMAGLVGDGLLTAAAAGDMFASPTAEAVLAALRAVTGPAGALCLVLNYTGDRLNFGLAAEQAKAEGLKVELVVMEDDTALPDRDMRRGLAGSVLAIKVAGAAAAAGRPLEAVRDAARSAVQNVGSVGVAATVCTLPGAEPSGRIPEGEIEFGLGVHGEPGAFKQPMEPVDTLVPKMLETIVSKERAYLMLEPGARVGVLVNNLGGSTLMEAYVVLRAALHHLTHTMQVQPVKAWAGSFLTSVDMAGVSISVMKLDDDRLELLDAAAAAPGWGSIKADCGLDKQPRPVPQGKEALEAFQRPQELSGLGQRLERSIQAACSAVIESADQLDAWDSKVGDGDCGSTLRLGADAVAAAATASLPLNDPSATARGMASTVGQAMGGTSGAIYRILFTAAAGALASSSASSTGDPSPLAWAEALKKATEAILHYSGAKAGARTMMDALVPAADAALDAANSGGSGKQVELK
ncbi:hypothetical protein WJX84_007686 [Apatococcus fuscideae]|uniref:Dihydroxyacetone kinase n=1 Tax=Apatococcus fuscideae TaxID=2026836 RepID=A0AAW1TDI0_9CHLO